MDAKQRESNEAGEQPQMNADFAQMWCSATEAKILFARDASVNFCALLRLFAAIPGWELSPIRRRAVSQYRAGGIRTHDLLNPIQAHYQAVLRPDVF